MSTLRAFKAACSTLWATTPEHLQLILDVVSREHVPDLDAVAAKRANYLSGTDAALKRDGVAIIPVEGTITRYANFFTDFSGGATVDSLSRDFNAALNDPSVTAILFHVDSPGGEANGVNEFAQMIYDARGKKPMVAYVGGMAASAAYWIASAADQIIADKTALLGSIGVVATVPNPDARNARSIEFVSSQSPRKRPNPNAESGRAQIQMMVDDLAGVFIESVARNRKTTADDVEENFGRGAVFVGQKAVDAGLANDLGSFEQTLSNLAAGKPLSQRSTTAASAAEEDDMTLIEKIKALVNGEEVEATATTGNQSEIEAAETKRVAAEAESKRLHQELMVSQREHAKAEAESFISAQVVAGKLFPAEKAGMLSAYTQAAMDDLSSPLVEGSRVATLKATIEARPAHKLTEELTAGGNLRTVRADENGQTEMSEERRKELLAHTGLGQSTLRAVK